MNMEGNMLVTGGAGFIGSNLAEELLESGHNVTVIDNLSTGRLENISTFRNRPRFKFVEGSITDLELLKKVFEDIDYVFHQAAIPSVPRSVRDPVSSNEANISGTLNVLVAARDSGVKKVVYAASSSAYGDTPTLPKKEDMKPNPLSPYAISKLAGEYYCSVFSSVYGLDTVSLRYFNVFGPRQDPTSQYAAVIPNFITRILQGKPPVIYGDGEQSRDFTYIKNVVSANMKAMESDAKGVYNIACGTRITVNELAEKIMDIVGARIQPVHELQRQGDIKHSLADITRAGEAFGYRPEYSIDEGLKDTVEWYQRN